MPVLYIREQGTVVSKHGGRLRVLKKREELLEIRLLETTAVAVFGNVQITTQAIAELLERGIPVFLFSRNGILRGRIAGDGAPHLPLRMAQYEMSRDSAACLALAGRIVDEKLRRAWGLLGDYRAHYPGAELKWAQAAQEEGRQRVAGVRTMDQLRGVEGAAAAAYFRGFEAANRSGLRFTRRSKRPPRDPVNALLSLGYTLLLSEVRAVVEAVGFEANLGFLHALAPARPSLVLDAMEPFRAEVVDRLVLRLLNERILRPEHFLVLATGHSAGGVVLEKDGLRRFLVEYEGWVGRVTVERPAGWRGEIEAFVDGIRLQVAGAARREAGRCT